MLPAFLPDDEFAGSGFTKVVAGRAATDVVGSDAFGFALGAAISLLTRTDAGT